MQTKHRIKLWIISQIKINRRTAFLSFGLDDRENIYTVFVILHSVYVNGEVAGLGIMGGMARTCIVLITGPIYQYVLQAQHNAVSIDRDK